MALLPVRHISVGIERPPARVGAYLAEPANFAFWATGLGSTLRPVDQGEWLAEGPSGPMRIRFSEANSYGVADHVLLLPGGGEIVAPLRVLANGDGSEVVFSLFRRPAMDEAEFERDAEWVRNDLLRLKEVLEAEEA